MGEHELVSDAVENLFEIRAKANASFLVLRDLFFYPSSRAVMVLAMTDVSSWF
jgi:hypothetical protein